MTALCLDHESARDDALQLKLLAKLLITASSVLRGEQYGVDVTMTVQLKLT